MTETVNYAGVEQHSAAAVSNAGSRPLLRPEPIICADEIAYVLFEKPDLGRQSEFLQDFGMTLADTSEAAIYLRGCSSSPWFYAAYRGKKSRYLGAGFVVKDEADLRRIAEATGSTPEPVDGPGGGWRVRLRDPDGFIVDLVYGRSSVEALPCRQQPLKFNTPWEKARINERSNTVLAPSALERLGHVVLSVTDFKASSQWYMQHLGLIPSDVQCVADGTPTLAFMRCDRGSVPADHHTVVLAQNAVAKYMHSAYETLDIDSIGQGAQYLRWRGWTHFWGIGRHILGSQLFDYWLDPCGDELEHYADGDMYDNSVDTQYHVFDRGGLWAWGHDLPPSPKPSLLQILKLILSGKSKQLPMSLLKKAGAAMRLKPRPWLD